jgi:hypothetical protein
MHEFGLSGMRVGATTAVAIDQFSRAATPGLFGTWAVGKGVEAAPGID